MKIIRHHMPTKVIFGRRTIYKLKDEIKQLSLNDEKVAVICGKSAVSNGYVDIVKKQLSGIVEVFDFVEPDPTVENAKEIIKEVKKFSPSLIVAIGGGSPLDVAKVVSVMLTNEGELTEFIGIPEAFKKAGIPLVAIPTTSGSGSEVTPYAVLTDKKRLKKAPLISKYLFPVLAIDDPELTVTMSSIVTANTGIDALTHAIESFVSKRATEISKLYSLRAIELIANYLPRAYGNPKDIEAREKVMLASLLGGMAITDAGAGLIHTMAHVLGVIYRVPHGLANGVFLVPVLNFYGLSAEKEIKEIGKAMNFEGSIAEILEKLQSFLSFLGIPKSLREVGLTETEIPNFVNLVMEKKFLMGNLPKIPNERDVREIVRTNL
ncbi:Alcohol dehydrogenase [Desulfurobacterium thermolithotrophum DSM 11699]|uniref:Alcohol dehydrogenase n=1 Tax=Desulfurobacterium thermolithotrophum (strain DSM 11699 / BSA) TaxID=868864 RepID=F0S426_DESTD|nr:iron-containing alcohol dehydrogenase [Desulfurobacterium thermolithotrophum]ADY73598.1 Alcohol dehydrogenase [Desulfurobacterium thermolithotrophum DSM 11699]